MSRLEHGPRQAAGGNYHLRRDVGQLTSARHLAGTRGVQKSVVAASAQPSSASVQEGEYDAHDIIFTVCTTTAQTRSAIAMLAKHEYVCLDCEGRAFGKVNGALSLLCLGTPVAGPKQHIFIFDVPALLSISDAVAVLSAFLSNTSIIKVTFDGRCDYLEIRDALGVKFQPVLDLQLAEVLARPHTSTKQMLSLHFGSKYAHKKAKLLEGIRCISGMDPCMTIYAPSISLHKNGAIKEMHRRGESYRWMERPLSSELLQYAATDIRAISHLLNRFRSRNIVPSKNSAKLANLLQNSTRYVTRNGVSMREAEHAPGAFSIFSGDRTTLFPVALSSPLDDLLACRTCCERLPLVCYQVEEGRRRLECRACVAWMEAPQVGRNKRDMVQAPAGLRVPADWVEISRLPP